MNYLAIIPAHNEAPRIADVVRRAREHVGRVVVVDDGSEDDTTEVARVAGAMVLTLPTNLGYGAALQTGYLYAHRNGWDALVQLDADGQHDPADIPRLLKPIIDGECDLVVGSRFLGGGQWRGTAVRRVGMRFFAMLVKLFTGRGLTDPTSGFQAMNRRIIERFSGDDYPDDFPDADVLLMLIREKYEVREIGVEMRPPPDGKTMHAGLRPIYYVLKMLLCVFIVMLRIKGGIEE